MLPPSAPALPLAPAVVVLPATAAEVFEACRVALGREPSVLDWSSGLELVAALPHLPVFSPPMPGPSLPYLDESVDVVVLRDGGQTTAAEARRVAALGVAVVEEGPDTVDPTIRRLSPQTKVIIDTIDLHFLREARSLLRRPLPARNNPRLLPEEFARSLARELSTYAAADAVLTVSSKEASLLNEFLGDPPLGHALPLSERLEPSGIPYSNRWGVVFVGNFWHTPNRQALQYLTREIIPRLEPGLLEEHPVLVTSGCTVAGEGDNDPATGGSLAGVDGGRAERAAAAEPLVECPGGAGGASPRGAGSGRRRHVHSSGTPGGPALGGCRGPARESVQPGRAGGRDGLAAVEPRHGGGQPTYGPEERERILAEVRRPPEREQDGTATWSLVTLQRALRRAPDGLPRVST